MAEFNAKASKVKALAVARTVSRKSGSTIAWINLTPAFSTAIFGCDPKHVTAQQMRDTLPALYNNDMIELLVTDLTEEITPILATDF